MLYFENLLKNKITYLVLLIIVFISRIQQDIVKGIPGYVSYTIYGISFLILFYKNYQFEKKIKEKSSIALNIFVVLFFSIFLSFAFKIPLKFLIAKCKSSKEIIERCEITNFISGRNDRIAYKLDGQNYEISYDNEMHLTREDLMKNYKIFINYSSSWFNTKVINNYSIERK